MDRCDGCKFWTRFKNDEEKGRCKRFPPSIVPIVAQVIWDETGDWARVDESTGVFAWPATFDDDWCGEWRRGEVK
jgi:hypothetical protein